MPKYKVHYSGWYIVEADNVDEAVLTDRADAVYDTWENEDAVYVRE